MWFAFAGSLQLGTFLTRFPTALDLAIDLSNPVKSPSPTISSISSNQSSSQTDILNVYATPVIMTTRLDVGKNV